MLITILYCAPIVLSVVALIFCLIKGFNKVAFFTSAAVPMVIEMFVVKYVSNSWYMFLFSLFVPMAVLYTGFSLYMSLKEGKTSPPKRVTEDLLLSAMESASSDEFPAGVERKGIGTPATRAAIIEKLVQKGFIERRGDKKTKYLC